MNAHREPKKGANRSNAVYPRSRMPCTWPVQTSKNGNRQARRKPRIAASTTNRLGERTRRARRYIKLLPASPAKSPKDPHEMAVSGVSHAAAFKNWIGCQLCVLWTCCGATRPFPTTLSSTPAPLNNAIARVAVNVTSTVLKAPALTIRPRLRYREFSG